MDYAFWAEIGVPTFIGLAGFAIAWASWRTARGAAAVSRAADRRQQDAAERAARHEAARALMRYLQTDDVAAVVDARFAMASHGLVGFTDVVGWAIDEVNGTDSALRSFVLVLVQDRLVGWVLSGELDRASIRMPIGR